MKEFHQIQLTILQQLLYSEGLRFSQIKPEGMEGSQFTFHLDQLQRLHLILKEGDKYILTESGKELANRMDLGDQSISSQAKVSVLLACTKVENNEKYILLYTRHKSPFYGFQGFPTGKVKKGETILNAANRELKEETNLIGESKLIGIRHYIITNSESEMIEDKVFFICRFENPKGEIIQNPEGLYNWVKSKDVWNYLKKPVPEIKEILEHLGDKEISFYEGTYSTNEF